MKYLNEIFYISFVIFSGVGAVLIVSLSKLRATVKDECEIMQTYLRQICVNTSERVKRDEQILRPAPGIGRPAYPVPMGKPIDKSGNPWIP